MKKNIVISSIAIIVVTVAVAVTAYILSFHHVTVSLQSPDIAGNIVQVDTAGRTTRTISAVPTTKPVSLQDGKYAFIASGTVYDASPIFFQVTGHDTSVTVNPSYSTSHLQALLQNELPTLSALIQSTYSTRLESYKVSAGALYQKGEWYGTTIVGNPTPDGAFGDTYHVVLQKVNGTWQIVTTPEIVLTTHSYPNIPKSILTAVNNL